MIYVCVPAYNEASTVGLLLWKVRQVFGAFPREYQLLVINDGSSDGTDEVLAPYTRALPLTLVTHRERQGYGRSLEQLLRLALERTDRPRRDMAVTIQADFSDSPDDIPELVRRIESGADIAVLDGRRREGAARLERVARRLLRALVRPLAKVQGVEDYVGTFRAYRLATLARLLRDPGSEPLLVAEGWAADVELLVKAARYGRRIDSVAVTTPVAHRQRSSRGTPLRSAWRVIAVARRLGHPAPAEAGRQRPRRGGRRGRGRPPGRPAPSPSTG